jgi:nucleoside-diphosphate-sugar epimerase
VNDNLLAGDLEFVLDHARDDIREFAGCRLFVTGGTGFVGSWLVESLLWANRRLDLGSRVVLLTRSPDLYRQSQPHLAFDPAVELVQGDVCTVDESITNIDAVIHAATPASAKLSSENPARMLDVVLDGMRSVLRLAADAGRVPFLFTSSGAVYGRQPPELSHVDETYLGGPDSLSPASAYHEGKRVAELMGSIAANRGQVDVKIARMFAFVGPHLPIDAHFAIGNFIRDALQGGPVVVRGDGTAVRSYLYGADMAIWLWRVLVRGIPGRAYNVGSEHSIDVRSLAHAVASTSTPPLDVIIHGNAVPGAEIERYVPSTRRACAELGLQQRVDSTDAITRTIAWHRARKLSAN